jgi:predicted RNA-binding protein with PUA-like domain
MQRWLVKTEPQTYSLQDLKRDGVTEWDGVRNALAQQYLRQMECGDVVLIYHSGKEKAVVGEAMVEREKYLDSTDPKGKAVCVDFKFREAFEHPIPLAAIKANAKLQDMELVRISRLSVMPVSEAHWKVLMSLKKKG